MTIRNNDYIIKKGSSTIQEKGVMSILLALATAKAYEIGFEDGKNKATPRFLYILAKQSGRPTGIAYFEGYAQGERSIANQERHFIN